jgi:predicted dehydrogenase
MNRKNILALLGLLVLISCNNDQMKSEIKPVRLITLDPGHFHAALVQKTMYDDVDSTVHVYAPESNDLQLHLDRINGYNTRRENPTHWNEEVYKGDDFFEKMIAEKKGNVVVLSGNNHKKSEYILKSLQSSFNVLADKPMVIDSKGFEELKQAFDIAAKNKLLLYDIMTERFEITSILQKELSMIPEVFGGLQKGTATDPAVVMESVHYFYKYISGNVVVRPGWFMDASQQGEGIIDVMTHLVDLVQWECFPEQILDYNKDIRIITATRWPTAMNLSEFKTITKLDNFPDYLKNNIKDTVLQVYSNGEINYQVKGVHARTYVVWNYKAAEGTGDTHHSIIKGTKAKLEIRQGPDEQFKPVLYIEPAAKDTPYETILTGKIKELQSKYPGIGIEKTKNGWKITIPEKYNEGHEAHFARVTENFLTYLKNRNMPAWEVPNMLSKYYTTTSALELATKSGVK